MMTRPVTDPNRLRHWLSALFLATAFSGIALLAATAASADEAIDALAAPATTATGTFDHSDYDQLLKTYVVASPDGINRVRYGAFGKEKHAALKAYLQRLTATDPRGLGRDEQFAYWANLYNAKTLDIVLDHYPVRSIRDITIDAGLFDLIKKSVGAGGPWKAKVVSVAGVELSLDNIEHDILRRHFRDPRVHYAVNCASYGCPNLRRDAFTGADLEAQLDAGARAFVNHPRGISVSADGNVTASSIYQWFQVDFGGTHKGVLDHARKYAEPALAGKLDGLTGISSFEYDWKLNDAGRSGSG